MVLAQIDIVDQAALPVTQSRLPVGAAGIALESRNYASKAFNPAIVAREWPINQDIGPRRVRAARHRIEPSLPIWVWRVARVNHA